MSFTKLQQEYEALRNEYHICRRKLDSKCEALLILSQDLDQCRQGRDQFKLMAEQVQARYQAMKRQLAGVGPGTTSLDGREFANMKQQNLAQLLCEMREVNKSQQLEIDDLKQKLNDAQGDIKILREQIARQRVGTTDEGINTRHFPAHEREDLVKQLEEAREQFVQIERDLQQVLDEKEELVTERDVYKTKYDRLNTELNFILKGDEKRIVDIDALSMENKYLQERLKQMEEEKTMAMATVSKYKSILERKKNKGIIRLGQSRSGGVVISQKQVQQLLENKSMMTPTPKMMSDLQSLASALLETLNDKNLALSHQRKTNKILGTRVAELENKLKTLEVAGLWNVPDKKMTDSLQKLCKEVTDIQTLIPTTKSPTPSDNTHNPNDKTPHGRQYGLALEDLDLLPTKERTAVGDNREAMTRQLCAQESTDTELSTEVEGSVVSTGEEEGSSEASSVATSNLLDPSSPFIDQSAASIDDDEDEDDQSEITEDSIENNLDLPAVSDVDEEKTQLEFPTRVDDDEDEDDDDDEYDAQQLRALLERATARVVGDQEKDVNEISDFLGSQNLEENKSAHSTPRCASPLIEQNLTEAELAESQSPPKTPPPLLLTESHKDGL